MKRSWASAVSAGMLAGLVGLSALPLGAERWSDGEDEAPIASGGGLKFQLSAGSAGVSRVPLSKSTPLVQAQLERLLARIPQIKAGKDDVKAFHFRERSLPAPRTAESNRLPFPNVKADLPKPLPAPTQLKVTGIAPKGEVEMAPHLTVSFNQPMVPVSSLNQVEAKDIPVKLTPTPPGKWRWLGTQTLMFVPDKRFPMATEYKVEIAAGTKSASGQTLEAAETATFATPALKLVRGFPESGSQPLDPLVFIGFNQDVDAGSLIRTIRVEEQGRSVPFHLAGSDLIAADKAVRSLVTQFGGKRCLVLKLDSKLSPSSSCTVNFGIGSPSSEGQRLTTSNQSFTFQTYRALAVNSHNENAQPGGPFYVSFNNALDASKCKAEDVIVTPPLPKQAIKFRGNSLVVYGGAKARSHYQVTLPASLTDVYGQRLGAAQTLNFNVGQAQKRFQAPHQGFIVLDPQGPRQLPFNVVNVKKFQVRAWRVKPEDWSSFLRYYPEWQRRQKDAQPPGQEILDFETETHCPPDEPCDFNLDLSKGFADGLGQLLVEVTPLDFNDDPNSYRPRYLGWIQSTQLGLDAMADSKGVTAAVNDLLTGKPIAGAQVVMGTGTGASEANTQADGSAILHFQGNPELLVARKGTDVAILPRQFSYYGGGSWSHPYSGSSQLWHVLDDRQLYKPGEKVTLKGWIRNANYGPKADISATGCSSVTYALRDSRGNVITKGSTSVGQLGAFNFQVELPKTMNLGQAYLNLTSSNGQSHQHGFQVQEFRRPEFEVSTSSEKPNCLVGESGTVSVGASYFSGGALANAKVAWQVSSSLTSYAPPNWSQYSFGSWTPWFSCYRWWDSSDNNFNASSSQSYQTQTDSNGKSTLKLDFQSVETPRPQSVTAQATVQDVNRQAFSSSSTMLVHACPYYVGLKSDKVFVEQGQPLELSCVVTDVDGKVAKGKQIQIKAFRWDWSEGEVKKVDEVTRQLVSEGQPMKVSLPTKEGGTYQVEATVSDERNRQNQSQLNVWVAGGKVPPSLTVETEAITLIPGKKEYEPGQTAEVLVQAPFPQAELTVTVRRQGIASVQHLRCIDGTARLKIPVEDVYIPGVTVQVDAVGPKVRTDLNGKELPGKPLRPAIASGSVTLNVSRKSREIQVEVTPAARKLAPGSQTEVEVVLKDWQGKPLQGDVTLVMVDESVLALSGYSFADPLNSFCYQRAADVLDAHIRQYLLLNRLPEAETDADAKKEADDERVDGLRTRNAPGNSAGEMFAADAPVLKSETGKIGAFGVNRDRRKSEAQKQQGAPIKVRTNFAALAAFIPGLSCDSQGRVKAKVHLPDSLTRYRVVALAASGDKLFGKGESSITARQALMVRPSAPRFLNFGDQFELPVVLQNQTDAPMTVEVGCRASNAKIQGGRQGGVCVQVPANDRVEVRLPASADKAGTARFQFAAASGSEADAAEVSLPVYTPATTEAFATYGVIDAGAVAQPVEAPRDAIAGFGNLSLSTSSTALSELCDAFIYLYAYPFECSEQVSSRMISAAALKDVLQAFEVPGLPSKSELEAAFQRDLKRLQGTQNYDGGWDYWEREKPSLPYLTVHVTHALVLSKSKGFKVSEQMLEPALNFLKNIDSHIPADYSESCKLSIRCYAAYVLNLAGQPQLERARTLANREPSQQSPEAIGWLLPTLCHDPAAANKVQELLTYLDSKVTQTAAHANFYSSYKDQDYLLLASDHRDDAVLLGALIEAKSDSPLLPKLVRGLLDHRTKGRWSNTQENCWVLIALDKYFHKFESQTPDFVARMWLGDRLASEQQFKGRSKDENLVEIPLEQLGKADSLTLQKEGTGRLYYRLGMTYAPVDLKLAAADYGFVVSRNYEALGDNRDVRKDAQGVWHVKAGSEVKVTLAMQVPSRRYHVALVDPLPAGFEPLNPALRGSGSQSIPRSSHSEGWWSYNWYEHQNLRDERVEAFSQQLWGGVYTYSYTARATTPGKFVVPPTKAEEMYHPETFGRSASDQVIVE